MKLRPSFFRFKSTSKIESLSFDYFHKLFGVENSNLLAV